MNSFYQKYLLPGLVFQGVVIGGGYATGRELVEFFLPHGPIGGLLSMGVAALLWSIVMAVSFELCRITKSYDYKTFFKLLLGRFWFIYEILLMLLMIVVLSVIGSAAGELIQNLFHVSTLVGTLGLLMAIGVITFYGSHLIEKFMGTWSILLYLCYLTLVILCFATFPEDIKANFATATVQPGWLIDGFRYAGYNLATVPVVFFCLTHLTQRKEAITAGLLAGVIGMSPAVFLFVAMMGQYPEIGQASIPSTELLGQLGLPWFSILFQAVLLGTFVQTGVGLIHSVNERICATLHDKGKKMPELARPIIAIFLLIIALFMATSFGLVNLIANGYGLLTIGFIIVMVLPILTIGLYKVIVYKNA
ncbi:MAG: putative membrane protein YkvI [Alteromonadaceae bacterium]|jgi:uncharacterized membrane protein YkvI